jgi:heme/copper-type cytochrome/quinol oxidase subunit 3
MSSGAIGRIAAQGRARPHGGWGVLLLIATEAALFATLIASYFYLRFNSPNWPPAGTAAPRVVTPAVLTGVLVISSVPMALAARSANAGAARRTWALLAGALAIQGVYLGVQLSDLLAQLAAHPASQSTYFSIYYTLICVHHAHVVVGLLLVAGLLLRVARGLTRYRAVGVGAVALYWHFTNVVAVAVLLTQLSPAL